MKPWISSEPPARARDTWLNVLARRLRDWLNGFLLEPGHLKGDESYGPEGVSSQPASSPPDAQDQGPAPNPGLVEQTKPPAWWPDAQAVPPEEWLALVREGAPELLLPVEEGGTPWYRATSENLNEREPVEEEFQAPKAPLPVSGAQPLQFEKVPEKTRRERANSTATKMTWRQSIKEWFATRVFSSKTKEKLRPQPAHAGLSPDRGERVKQRPQDILPAGAASESSSKARVAENVKSGQPVLAEAPAPLSFRSTLPSAPRKGLQPPSVPQIRWQVAHSSGATCQAEALQSGSEVYGNSSEVAVRFRKSEQACDGAAGRQPEKKVRASISDSEQWPVLGTARNPGALPPEKRRAGTNDGKSRKDVFPAAPSTPDSGILNWRPSPKPERDDRWPELPEDRPMNNTRSMELLRSSERLRALDLEQKGGR